MGEKASGIERDLHREDCLGPSPEHLMAVNTLELQHLDSDPAPGDLENDRRDAESTRLAAQRIDDDGRLIPGKVLLLR